MKPPSDPADHAVDFARRYWRELDEYCALRMQELGLTEHFQGATDFEGNGKWKAFIEHERTGGNITDGISVNSGCLNPDLIAGSPGADEFARARLRDRIDAIIAHEYEEDRLGDHALALQHGPETALRITEKSRELLRAIRG